MSLHLRPDCKPDLDVGKKRKRERDSIIYILFGGVRVVNALVFSSSFYLSLHVFDHARTARVSTKGDRTCK